MTTKMDVLRDRLIQAEATAVALRNQIDGLWATNCGLQCSGCGEVLDTEGDFASHFVLPQISIMQNTLNLGECPYTERGQAIAD